jgi:cytosine/uracil/thiamine/allantoin permease
LRRAEEPRGKRASARFTPPAQGEAIAALLSVFLVPAFYTRHTTFQQALSISGGLVAAILLRMLAHWWLRRLQE